MSESYPCRGGCGKYMPQGQSCFDCAVKSIDAWKQRAEVLIRPSTAFRKKKGKRV